MAKVDIANLSDLLLNFDFFGEPEDEQGDEFEFVNPTDSQPEELRLSSSSGTLSKNGSFSSFSSMEKGPASPSRPKWRISKTVQSAMGWGENSGSPTSGDRPKSKDFTDELENPDSTVVASPRKHRSSRFLMSRPSAEADDSPASPTQSPRMVKSKSAKFFRAKSKLPPLELMDPKELTPEMKDFMVKLQNKSKRFELISDLVKEKSELATKVRFVSVVDEFSRIENEEESETKGQRICNFFLKKGSMFYLNINNEEMENLALSGTFIKEILEKVKYDCIVELLDHDIVASFMQRNVAGW